jgi:FkbM family methyltransferase
MSLPNYPHLKHWLADAISNTPINIGPDYLRYQDMFLSKRFGPQAIMIDVGCNHGLAALPVAALGHKVVCFEPVKYNYEKLVQSQIFNNFKNPMTIVNAALGARSSNVSIYVPTLRDDNASLNPRASISNLPNSKYTKETVEMITLDDFLDQNSDVHSSKIEFVKVDVQGFEEFVMKGSVRFLRDANSKIIIECEFSPKMIQARGGHPIQLLAFMHDQSYQFSWNGNLQTPDNFVSFIQSIGDSQVDIEFSKK